MMKKITLVSPNGNETVEIPESAAQQLFVLFEKVSGEIGLIVEGSNSNFAGIVCFPGNYNSASAADKLGDAVNKEKCIQFHQWVARQHYVGFPKVQCIDPAPYKSAGVRVYERDMTISELYDHYEALPELQKKTAFLP